MTFLQIQKKYKKLLRQKEKGIVKNYSKAYKELEQEVKRIYSEYEQEGQISLDDLLRYNRLQKIDNNVARAMIGLYTSNKILMDKTFKTIVNDTITASTKAVDGKEELKPIKKIFNTEELIDKEIGGRKWTERMKHYSANSAYDIQTTIRAGIERGDSYTTVCRELKQKLGKDINNPMAIVRTESARIVEETTYETMQELSKQAELTKTWHTMADERVRSSHASMEGITVGMDEEFTLPSGATCMYPHGTGIAEEDINCRCYLSYSIKRKGE